MQIPDTGEISEQEAKTVFAARFYEMGKLSLSQAAEMAGYSYREFIGLLDNFNVSVFYLSEEDLESDLCNIKHIISNATGQ